MVSNQTPSDLMPYSGFLLTLTFTEDFSYITTLTNLNTINPLRLHLLTHLLSLCLLLNIVNHEKFDVKRFVNCIMNDILCKTIKLE